MKFRTNKHEHHCSCSACEAASSQSWGVALAAGIVPCPGTVVIFIFTFVIGNYLIGILSAIAMALGIGIVIFISSLFAQYLHANISNKFHRFFVFIEYFAIAFMLILGVLLILSPIRL